MEQVGLLQTNATNAWRQAVSDFYNPPLPEPIIDHDEEASSFFFIDSNDWTVHLNTAGVPLTLPPELIQQYLRSVCHHEIQHYLLCPYDGVTNGMMFAGARKYLSDSIAMFACNIFADLVVDSHLLKRYQEITHFRITTSIHDSALRTREHSPLWKLVIATYRWMWGFRIPTGVYIDQKTIETAQEVVNIAKEYIDSESRWPKATEMIAKIIADWFPDQDSPMGGTGLKEEADAGTLLVPVDIDSVMGSPTEDRNGDRARRCISSENTPSVEEEMERLAIEVDERGGSLRDLEGVYIMAGSGTGGKDWIRFWYRAKVRGLLRFQVRKVRPQGSVPLSPSAWRLGDPIEDLDVVQSLQAFPVLVPNMSTRKWQRSMTHGADRHVELPDLLVVVDSSGSMTWSMGPKDLRGAYHVALVAGLAAVDTAYRKGSNIAAINFSGNILKCGWTRDRSEVEGTLLAYQGGGTVMPVKTIKELCQEANTSVMSVIITDTGVSNWGPFVKTIDTLSRQGHRMFIFHIGGKKDTISKAATHLIQAGAIVIPVSSIKDLPGLVISEVQRTYFPRT